MLTPTQRLQILNYVRALWRMAHPTSQIWLKDTEYDAFRASLRSDEVIYPMTMRDMTPEQRTIQQNELLLGAWYRIVRE